MLVLCSSIRARMVVVNMRGEDRFSLPRSRLLQLRRRITRTPSIISSSVSMRSEGLSVSVVTTTTLCPASARARVRSVVARTTPP